MFNFLGICMLLRIVLTCFQVITLYGSDQVGRLSPVLDIKVFPKDLGDDSDKLARHSDRVVQGVMDLLQDPNSAVGIVQSKTHQPSSDDEGYYNFYFLTGDQLICELRIPDTYSPSDRQRILDQEVRSCMELNYLNITYLTQEEYLARHYPPLVFALRVDKQPEKTSAKREATERWRESYQVEQAYLVAQREEHEKKEEEKRKRAEIFAINTAAKKERERQAEAAFEKAEAEKERRERERNAASSQAGLDLQGKKDSLLEELRNKRIQVLDMVDSIQGNNPRECSIELLGIKSEIEAQRASLLPLKGKALQKKILMMRGCLTTFDEQLREIQKLLQHKELSKAQEPIKVDGNDKDQVADLGAEKIFFEQNLSGCSCLNNNSAVLGAPVECAYCKLQHDPGYDPLKRYCSTLNPNAPDFSPRWPPYE